MNSKIISLLAAGVMAVSAMAANAAETLRVGTHPSFAPFEFVDTASREYVGFDMDLIREAGKRAGYDVEIVNMGFDGLIPALISGNIDMAVAGITITKARAERVDFCKPYYLAGQAMLVRTETANKYTDLKSLEGKRVAVEIGTTGADLAKTIKGVRIKSFNAAAEAFMELKMEGVEAVLLDRPVIGYFAVRNPRVAKGLTMQPATFESESFGFAVKKGNTELRTKIDKAVDEMRADGTYDKLMTKWFGKY